VSFNITKTTANGTYVISGTNGSQSGTTGQLSVGAPFTISVGPWSFGGCSANITQVVVSINSNDFIVEHDDCGNYLTNYSIDKGVVYSVSTYTWTPCSGTKTEAVIALYAGKTSASQTITVHAYYSFGGAGGSFDESVTFDIVVQNPTSTFTLTAPTSPNQYQFGPFLQLQRISGVWTDVTQPVGWFDSNWTNQLNPSESGRQYLFGGSAAQSGGGPNAWRSSGTITNGTSSSGYSYVAQNAKQLLPPEVAFAKTGAAYHRVAKDGEVAIDISDYATSQPRDGSGNTLWGIDARIGFTQFPWAYSQDDFTRSTAGSGMLAVPPANSINDPNRVKQSYYSDNPSGGWRNASGYSDGTAYIEANYNLRLMTFLVWHPDGGVPIGLWKATWSIDSNEYNLRADQTASAIEGNQSSGNWDLTKTFQTYSGSPVQGQYYVQWDYNGDDYNNFVFPSVIRKRVKGAFPGIFPAPIGPAPINGAIQFGAVGPGLPRCGVSNFLAMNGM
jgi:hypothetical protein